MKVKVEKDTWFITEGEKQHFGKLNAGQTYETILKVNHFDNEKEWEAEVERLGLKQNNPLKMDKPNFNKN